MLMSSPHIPALLSESLAGECDVTVLVRKRIYKYVDERNCHSVPPVKVEAGVGV